MTLPDLQETLIMPDPAEPTQSVLELDELWSFVRKRVNKRWIWIALCRATRQVVASVVGDRSRASCRKLWQQIPAAYRTAHCRERLLGSLPGGHPQAATYGSGQRDRLDCSCREMEQHFAAKAWAFREKEPVFLQVRCDARIVFATLSA
jgi:hypothetical protein